ncbi:hypothetical protein JCM10914A_40940 [Paenibacillus sp. JCM 10914]|uniref:YjgB family protein n=1 Tax=Paenibacillus sp. JCM 10914 TaxID=1236974 RepID=UPI0003CC2663|nr:YjgB family protein [Paenibacillus sp. JCM 10914]GAE05307.1 YjgB [Paenibacillus sp. JCM 10914]
MASKRTIRHGVVALTTAGVVGLGAIGVPSVLAQQQLSAAPAPVAKANDYAAESALNTLMSFYKPALKGQFPGAVSGLTVGASTKQDVFKKIGEPSVPGKHADDFDQYGANMGNPGYAFSYKLNKLREMRYFGTNVERQTNIGGITIKMLKQHWYAPTSQTTFKNGNSKQTKITYDRGAYKLEFIFNNSTDLDHINLLKK